MKIKLHFRLFVVVLVLSLFSSANAQTDFVSQLYQKSFDNGTNWQEDTRMISSYDMQGREIINVKQYIQDNQWVNSVRTSTTYGTDNTITYILSEIWNLNSWQLYSSTTNDYSSSGKIVLKTEKDFTNNNWVDDFKEEYVYDSNDKLVNIFKYFWNASNLNWSLSSRKTHTYTGIDYIIATENWSVENEIYTLAQDVEYSHDAQGRIMELSITQYNTNGYFVITRYTYHYNDDSFNPYKLSTDAQFSSTPDFMPFFQDIYTYNADGKISQSIGEIWENNSFIKKGKTTYFYPTLSTRNFTKSLGITAYPNPFTETLTLENSALSYGMEYSMYDTAGREVLSGNLSDGKTLLQNLNVASGVYFITIGNGKSIKVVRQ